jgi:hypothetical protein
MTRMTSVNLSLRERGFFLAEVSENTVKGVVALAAGRKGRELKLCAGVVVVSLIYEKCPVT